MKEFEEFERIDEMKMFINHGIHRIHGMMVSIAVLFGIVGLSHAGVVEATSPVFGLSLKHDGVRQSAGTEMLTYSSQWDGGEGATVTIAENGAVIDDGMSGIESPADFAAWKAFNANSSFAPRMPQGLGRAAIAFLSPTCGRTENSAPISSVSFLNRASLSSSQCRSLPVPI